MARSFLLLLVALWLSNVPRAHAQSPVQASCRDDYAGMIDGNVVQPEPANVKIDTNCTIRNYPGGMSTNFSFDSLRPLSHHVRGHATRRSREQLRPQARRSHTAEWLSFIERRSQGAARDAR